MSLRTYLPFLRLLLKKVCRYIAEHEERIKRFLDPDAAVYVDGVVAACELLMPFLDAAIPDGS